MIEIKNLKVDGDLVLAPMAGYTDSPFRSIAKKHGASLVFTELISADGIVRMNRKTLSLIRFTDEERPIGIQIFGKDPDIMSRATSIVEELKPDLIDINIGCSTRKVYRSGSGAALLKDPELLGSIITSITKKVTLPVSAKIRIGDDDQHRNYIDIVKLLQDSGVSLISVHGRTRSQKFSGEADWEVIREIKEIAYVPVIGNGDIKSYSEAKEKLIFSGCDAVMIGRGAIGNPWIFSGYEPTIKETIDQIKKHLKMMVDFYGERGIKLVRKHIAKYIYGIENAGKIRYSLMNSESKDEILSLLESLSSDIPEKLS